PNTGRSNLASVTRSSIDVSLRVGQRASIDAGSLVRPMLPQPVLEVDRSPGSELGVGRRVVSCQRLLDPARRVPGSLVFRPMLGELGAVMLQDRLRELGGGPKPDLIAPVDDDLR